MIWSRVEVTWTLARRFSVARLRAARGDLWMSGDNGGMGKNDSSDGRLGSGGPVTCIRPFFPWFLGRLVLESAGKVG